MDSQKSPTIKQKQIIFLNMVSSNIFHDVDIILIFRPDGPIEQRQSMTPGEKQFVRRFGRRPQLTEV